MKKVINEDTLKKIVYEAAMSVINESLKSQMSFGVKGPLPTKPTNKLDEDFPPEVKAAFERVAQGDKSAKINPKLLGKPEYLGNTFMWKVYQQYANAMNRRADLGRSDVGFGTFYKKLIYGWFGPMSYYESDGNYLFGTEKAGLFLCVYFAPKNVGVGMFKFIKEICEYNNVVFSVTEDLANMLERLGCPKWNDGQVMQVKCRHGLADKKIYGSTQEAADEGAKLVGMMSSGKQINQNLQSVIAQNPQLQSMYEKDPDLITKFMYDPVVLKYMMNHPDIIEKFIADPTVAQQAAADPIGALKNYLQKKGSKKRPAPKVATSSMNEMKKKKNGSKL